MRPDQLAYRRRTLVVGAITLLLWALFVLVVLVQEWGISSWRFLDEQVELGVTAWAFTAIWIAFDAYLRRAPYIVWTLAGLATGPIGGILYLIFRPWTQPVCLQCGSPLTTPGKCQVCGYEGWMNGAGTLVSRIGSDTAGSLVSGPIEKIRHTIKYASIALAVTFIMAYLTIQSYQNPWEVPGALQLLLVISGAGYWVLTAWWVYLDATWRRMTAIPWAMLTLVTNIIGLVTYLVIRYPDPHVCSQCGAQVPNGLKRCPYCGTETEPICPHCQSPVRPDWAYCPACSGKLPEIVVKSVSPATIAISGTVVDAATGSPISGADVRIDSKALTISATTDAAGRYVLPDLTPRPYVLVASAEGYTMHLKTYEPQPGGPSQVSFSLAPDAAPVWKQPQATADLGDVQRGV